ncbi:MAG: hypothetical protein ACRC8K_22485, partial [Waterburya sp.]
QDFVSSLAKQIITKEHDQATSKPVKLIWQTPVKTRADLAKSKRQKKKLERHFCEKASITSQRKESLRLRKLDNEPTL